MEEIKTVLTDEQIIKLALSMCSACYSGMDHQFAGVSIVKFARALLEQTHAVILTEKQKDSIYQEWRDQGDEVSYGDLINLAEAAVLSANAGKVDAVQALPSQIHMDEIDADAAGRDWLRQINVANPEFRMEWMPDEGSQAPRIKWRALFDQKQRLRYAYLLNRDLKNFTQVTFIDADLTVPSTTQQAIEQRWTKEREQAFADAARRYEIVRKLNVPQFAELYRRNIAGEGRFDDLVDQLGEKT